MELKKVCIKCDEDKSLDCYKEYKKGKLKNICILCHRKDQREYSMRRKKENPDRHDEIREYKKKWASNNSESVLDRSKKYYNNNKERVSEKTKQWKSENRERFLEQRRNKHRERMDTDIMYRFNISIRSTIKNSIKINGFNKSTTTNEILGCSPKQFKEYLESKFENWMTWENYGKYNGELNYGWDIDHIIPGSSAKSEEEIINLNHFSNLQPLCSYTNRILKSNKLNF